MTELITKHAAASRPVEPIIAPNTLWRSVDPDADPDERLLASGGGRRDDARWSGASKSSPPGPMSSSTSSGPTACGRCCQVSRAARWR